MLDWLDTKGQLLVIGLRNSYPQEQRKQRFLIGQLGSSHSKRKVVMYLSPGPGRSGPWATWKSFMEEVTLTFEAMEPAGVPRGGSLG